MKRLPNVEKKSPIKVFIKKDLNIDTSALDVKELSAEEQILNITVKKHNLEEEEQELQEISTIKKLEKPELPSNDDAEATKSQSEQQTEP